jgi:glutamine amidotransferase
VKAGIVDYRMGNLASVSKGVERIGAEPSVSADATELSSADVLIIPGVGNFAAGMKNLADAGLVDFITEWARSDRPTIGICLGMQLLFEHSTEGDTEGLGLLGGDVVRLPDEVKVPHIGWNEVSTPPGSPFGAFDGRRFYFVHSYICRPANGMAAGLTSYGVDFVSIVATGNILGLQFHPEKSSETGLELLSEIFARFR